MEQHMIKLILNNIQALALYNKSYNEAPEEMRRIAELAKEAESAGKDKLRELVKAITELPRSVIKCESMLSLALRAVALAEGKKVLEVAQELIGPSKIIEVIPPGYDDHGDIIAKAGKYIIQIPYEEA